VAGVGVAFVVVFWIAPIVVGHQIGKRKGRAGWAWGLLLGWIGVIIVAVLSPRNTFECPWCREPVKLGAGVCPHCHREIPATPPAAAHGSPQTRTHQRTDAAVARVKSAEAAFQEGRFGDALSVLFEEVYEASRRRDIEHLQEVKSLAQKIEQATASQKRDRTKAARLAQTADAAIANIKSRRRELAATASRPEASSNRAEVAPVLAESGMASSSASSAVEVLNDDKRKFCERCGQTLGSATRFCGACGQPVPGRVDAL